MSGDECRVKKRNAGAGSVHPPSTRDPRHSSRPSGYSGSPLSMYIAPIAGLGLPKVPNQRS